MHNGNVLVVEDDDTIRRLLVEYLKQHSYLHVDGARDGIEALHRISTDRYAIVILDVVMPKMSGVDFLDSLQAMTSDPSVKSIELVPAVIIITATAETLLPSEVMHQRFPQLVRRVFRKPIDFLALASAIEEQLG
ncbi:MAG: chemotaxis protein CheY [Acidobacteria bacterium]|nr:chemotaxis protein CheY [Acidobacteriota bacterium]